jgi:pimeloyl-ACP methyl ester carboxylesterase
MSYLPPKWQIPPDVKWIEVNGYPMAYQDSGSGSPLVLVHGAISDYRWWLHQFEPFARQHRVFCISLRHYFPEIWNGVGSDFSMVQHADDIGAFVTALGCGPVHLLGQSRGGAVAIETAKLHPTIIRSLILCDPVARLQLEETEDNKRAMASRAKRLSDFRQSLDKGDLEGGVERYYDALLGAGAWNKISRESQLGFLQNGWTGAVDDPPPLTTDDDLKKFTFPVLLLNGANSPPMFRLLAQEIQGRAKLDAPIVLPDVGHSMNFDNPAAFNAAVLDFTARH